MLELLESQLKIDWNIEELEPRAAPDNGELYYRSSYSPTLEGVNL